MPFVCEANIRRASVEASSWSERTKPKRVPPIRSVMRARRLARIIAICPGRVQSRMLVSAQLPVGILGCTQNDDWRNELVSPQIERETVFSEGSIGLKKLEEDAKSEDRAVQGRTDGESPAGHGIAVGKMQAAIAHSNPEMTGKLPVGAAGCGHVDV